MRCINVNHSTVQEYAGIMGLKPIIVAAKIGVWQDLNESSEFPSIEELQKPFSKDNVNYILKSIDILTSDKAKQIFDKGNRNNWTLDKILSELYIPKEQRGLIKDSYNELENPSLDNLILDLLNNYGYEIKIRNSKDLYYPELVVQGGINYTESEISTPSIIPSIKGHAGFSTENGIGWFRSDELEENTNVRRILEIQSDLFQKSRRTNSLVKDSRGYPEAELDGEQRPDLTVHKFLSEDGYTYVYEAWDSIYYKLKKIDDSNDSLKNNNVVKGSYKIISKEEFDNKNPSLTSELLNSDRFLKILNTDNNWINFFIKSIIQNSINNGYKKLLVPRLDTIIRIESQNKYKNYKEASDSFMDESWKEEDNELREKLKKYQEAFEDKKKSGKDTSRLESSIKYIKEEIRSHQPSLLSVANFYETDLANRLDDIAGGNKSNRSKGVWALNQVTDKYGNTWNELDLSSKKIQEQAKNVLLSKGTTARKSTIQIGNKNYTKGSYTFKEIFDSLGEGSYATKLLKNLYSLSNQKFEDMKITISDNFDSDEQGFYDPQTHTIRLNVGAIQRGDELFAHEVIHALTGIKLAYWEKKQPQLYKRLEEVYNAAQARFGGKNSKFDYALSNIHEFYAHLSEPEFLEMLNEQEDYSDLITDDKNIFRKLIDLLKDMLKKLGFKIEGTLAETALDNLQFISSQTLDTASIEEGKAALRSLYGVDYPVKKEVDKMFIKFPELSKIGTLSQYSEYLDSIFPNSKVKDIAYHGSRRIFDKFIKEYTDIGYNSYYEGLHFAQKEETALDRIDDLKEVIIYPVLLDINSLKRVEDSKIGGESLTHWHSEINTAIREKHDALIYLNTYEGEQDNSYVIFEPEQIHILGSKEDLEGFKKYVSKNKGMYSKKQEDWDNYQRFNHSRGVTKPTPAQSATLIKLAQIDELTDKTDKGYVTKGTTDERTRVSTIVSEAVPFPELNTAGMTQEEIDEALASRETVKVNSSYLGNQFDAIVDLLLLNKSVADVVKAVKDMDKGSTVTVSDEEIKKFVGEVNTLLSDPRFAGCYFLSQHTVSADKVIYSTPEGTKVGNISGTTDILAIHPDGKVSIIDLKTATYGKGNYKFEDGSKEVTQQYIYQKLYEMNGVPIKDKYLFIKELVKTDDNSEVLGTADAYLQSITKKGISQNLRAFSRIAPWQKNLTVEQIAEALDEKPSNTLDTKFWEQMEIAYNSHAQSLRNSSESGSLLYSEASSLVNRIKFWNEDKGEIPKTEVDKVVSQAASMRLFIDKLKYNLIDKESEKSKAHEGTTDYFDTILSNNLLKTVKEMHEVYTNPEVYESLTPEQHDKYNDLMVYITEYIKQMEELIKPMEFVMQESERYENRINMFLENQNEEMNFNSGFEDLRKVSAAIQKIKQLQKKSNQYALYLYLSDKTVSEKANVEELKAIKRNNAKLQIKIDDLEEQLVELNKLPKSEETDKKIASREKELEGFKANLRDETGGNAIMNLVGELADGGNFGIFKALFADIGSLSTKTMTLMRNKIAKKWSEMQSKETGMLKEIGDVWNKYRKEMGLGEFDVNDETIFKKFFENIKYKNANGKEVDESQYIQDFDVSAYHQEFHEVKRKIMELHESITAMYKALTPQNTEEDRNNVGKEARKIYAVINKLETDFVAKHDLATNNYESQNPSYILKRYLQDLKDNLKKAHGEKESIKSLSYFIRQNFRIGLMKQSVGYKITDEEYISNLIENDFNTDLLVSMDSELLKPKQSEFKSDKLASLNPMERELYDVLIKYHLAAQENLPAHVRIGYRLPSIPKDSIQRFLSKNKTDAFKDMLKEGFGDFIGDETTENTENKIPVYYTSNMASADVSKNLVVSTVLFHKQASAYKVKSDTHNIAKGMLQNIGKPKQTDQSGRQIMNKALSKLGIDSKIAVGDDWRLWFMNNWMEGFFYGKLNRPMKMKIGDYEIRMDKVLQKLAGGTAFGSLGGIKFISQATNISMANMAALLSSTGYFEGSENKQLFRKRDFIKAAVSDAMMVIKDMMMERFQQSEHAHSVQAQLIEQLEPIQGEFFDAMGDKITKTNLNKLFSSNSWFSIMQFGDLQPQLSTMIAMLYNIKVKVVDKDGSLVDKNLYEALTLTEDLQANWEAIENWKEVKRDLMEVKKPMLDDLNRKIHGNFKSMGNLDRPIIRQTIIGSLFQMYKKHIPPGLMYRWDSEHFNVHQNKMIEGSHRTLYRYLTDDMRWLKKSKHGIKPLDVFFARASKLEAIREYMSDEQIRNVRTAVAEYMAIFLTSVLGVVFMGMGGDDDDYFVMSVGAVLIRLSKDFGFYTPVYMGSPVTPEFFRDEKADDSGFSIGEPINTSFSDWARVFKQPFAVMRTYDNLEKLMKMLTTDPTALYERGDYKGESKAKVLLLKLFGMNYGANPQDVLNNIYSK